MKKMSKRIVTMIVIGVLLLSTLVACGQKSKDNAGNSTGKLEMEDSKDSGALLDTNSPTSSSKENVGVKENRKIIEKIYLNAQTKEFDALMEKLNDEIQKVGGYIEASSVSGDNFEYDDERYAELTVRVPAKQSDKFTEFVSKNSTITNKEISTEDVTLTYVDIESRISALETEKNTLERLMAKAASMQDVIAIQERLTEVIYEIESYQSQLRTYDNLIDYTTITIRIREVERVEIVGEQSIWQEIGTNLKEGFENVWEFLVRLFVFTISSIPYVLVVAVYVAIVVAIVAICIKRSKKKRKSKKDKEE